MRIQYALIGILIITGCQAPRAQTARCPHCNQSHAIVANQAPAAPMVNPVTVVSPVTYVNSEEPAPLPKNYAAAFEPVPAVPGVEE